MKAPAKDFRHTLMGDFSVGIRAMLARTMPTLMVLLGGTTAYLLINGKKGAACFGMTAAGVCFALSAWRKHGLGLPLLPMMAVQHLLLYGLPVLANKQTLDRYPDDYFYKAGVEILLFLGSMTLAWLGALKAVRNPRQRISHALTNFQREGSGKLRWICLALLISSTGYQIMQKTGLVDALMSILPPGSSPIIWDLICAAATCGFFIGGLLIGGREMTGWGAILYWFIVLLNCFMAASAFLLSTTAAYLVSVTIGLFWSTGRVPWRFILVFGVMLSFLNLGKDAMRDRYWRQGGVGNVIPDFALSEMPGHYSEWIGVSFDLVTGNGGTIEKDWQKDIGAAAAQDASQSLFERINNLENLLFVIEAEQRYDISPIYGASYAVIPALLIPRILYPDKPRSHEGQVLLNVDFGRQDLNSTLDTYVAWGLLPEAYGNFGPWAGALILGGVLGYAFGFLEKWSAPKLVISAEGFVSFTLFLGMANSYEMVASVLVTSVFQAIVPIVLAMLPFVHRVNLDAVNPPPDAEPAAETDGNP